MDDFNVLTETLNTFIAAFGEGFRNLWPDIEWLIGAFIVLEITLFGIWWALGKEENILSIFKKILFIGFWLWLVSNFAGLASTITESLTLAGVRAGGGGGAAGACEFYNPSCIAAVGGDAASDLMEQMNDLAWHDWGTGLGLMLSALLILVAFFIVAIQVFITIIEFYVLLAVSGILMPFGFNQHTKFLAEKAIAAIISSGVKLMVLAFIFTVTEPILRGLQFNGEASWEEIWVLLLVAWTIAFLAWNAPGMAAGLLSGMPSLSAASTAQAAFATGAIGGAAIGGGLASIKAASSAAGSAGRAGVGAATQLGSAASTGAKIGATGRSTRLGAAAGAVGGGLSASAGLVRSAVGAPFVAAANSAREFSQANSRIGSRSAFVSTGGSMTPGMKTADAADRAKVAAKPSSSRGGGSAMPAWAKKASRLSRTLSNEASGGGGFSVSL